MFNTFSFSVPSVISHCRYHTKIGSRNRSNCWIYTWTRTLNAVNLTPVWRQKILSYLSLHGQISRFALYLNRKDLHSLLAIEISFRTVFKLRLIALSKFYTDLILQCKKMAIPISFLAWSSLFIIFLCLTLWSSKVPHWVVSGQEQIFSFCLQRLKT